MTRRNDDLSQILDCLRSEIRALDGHEDPEWSRAFNAGIARAVEVVDGYARLLTPRVENAVCKNGHRFSRNRSVPLHEEWFCAVCYFVPSTRDLLAAYVEKHGGRVVA